MTPGPHNHTSGARAALFAFSRRFCYFPDCDVPVVRFVGDEPVVNVEIAHICGALPAAPRYDKSMTDDERRAFRNLILLCVPHHKTIDRLHPDDYSPEELTRWKHEHESPEEIATLNEITEDRLEQLIEEAVRTGGVQRRADLEITPGIAMQTGTFTIPGDQPGEFFDLYRDIGIPALLLVARNPGLIDAVVASHRIRLLPVDAAIVLPDTPYEALPSKLRAGHSLTWAYPISALYAPVVALGAKGYEVSDLSGEITLATGEEVISAAIPITPLGRLDRLPWN